jgi:hypothetical protein
MIREDGSQPHRPGVEDSFMADATQTCMPMYNLDSFSNDDISKDGEEGEDGWKRSTPVDDPEWDVVYFYAVGKKSHATSSFVCVRYYDDFVAAIDELRG